MPDDTLCNASEQNLRDGAVSVRAHHDQINPMLAGVLDDLDPGLTDPGHPLDRQVRLVWRGERRHPFLGFPLKTFFEGRQGVVPERGSAGTQVRVFHDVDQMDDAAEALGEGASVVDGAFGSFAEVRGDQDGVEVSSHSTIMSSPAVGVARSWCRVFRMGFPRPGSERECARFSELQGRLTPQYKRLFADTLAPRTVVVVPSLSLDVDIVAKITGAAHYEERLLCLLMLLRMPHTQVVYVTSVRIDTAVIDYYLHLLAGVPHGHSRKRLALVSCSDPSPTPLSAKILADPSVLRRIRGAIDDPALAHLVCFTVGSLERTLSVRLGVPVYGCDPRLSALGSKSGSRRVFRDAGIPLPHGAEDLRDAHDIAEGLAELKRHRPRLRRAVVKLNDGFSGEGNAVFRFRAGDTGPGLARRIARRLAGGLVYEAANESWDRYQEKFGAMGGIVEEFLAGDEVRSPSVQCRIDPRRHIEEVSTHEQVLGGPSGQVFVGCEFPARDVYRTRLQADARRVAQVLRRKGVLGRFAVDFVAVRSGTTWRQYAIEINLRKGGTTHPFLMLDFLTDGDYDPGKGVYQIQTGQTRTYVATDNLKDERYLGLTPDDLVEIAVEQQLHFHAPRQQGVVFHLLGALQQYGKLGMVCIGPDLSVARRLYRRTVSILNREGGFRSRRARVRRARRARL